MEDVESVAVDDRVGQRGPIDDQVVVEEDRDVLADRAGVVEHVAAHGGMRGEVPLERLTNGTCVDGRARAVDVTPEGLGELDFHHDRDCRWPV